MTIPTKKLGRLPQRHDLRTAQMINFISRTKLPPAPAARDWETKLPADLKMYLNDQYGDCGFAGQAHAIQTWTATPGPVINLTDAQVLAAYAGCTGFNANDPSTDQGVVLLDALNYWRKTGIGGHKIGAFLRVDPRNVDHIKIAINLFGGVYMGANLPVSAQHPGPWHGVKNLSGDNAPGSWGGHCMWAPGYSPSGVEFVTWGRRQQADWQWWLNYVDEAWAIVSSEWVTGTKPAPSGFNLIQLQTYLAAL